MFWKFAHRRPPTLRDCQGLVVAKERIHLELHQNGDETVI